VHDETERIGSIHARIRRAFLYRAGMPGTTATRDALRCVRCRYALEALPAGGPCPECGLAVAESAHRREVHAIRRLRAVRVGAVAWIVGVVAWALTIVPPMIGLLLHGFGSMAVLRAWVTVAMLVQTIAGGLALAGALPEVVYAAELGLGALLAGDLVGPGRSLKPADGQLPVAPMPPGPDPQLVRRFTADDAAAGRWRERLDRARKHL